MYTDQSQKEIPERFTFGIYKDRLIKDIIKINPGYVKWAVKKKLISLPKYLKI